MNLEGVDGVVEHDARRLLCFCTSTWKAAPSGLFVIEHLYDLVFLQNSCYETYTRFPGFTYALRTSLEYHPTYCFLP